MRTGFVIASLLAVATTTGCAARAPDLASDQLTDELMASREHNRWLRDELATCGVERAPTALLAELEQLLGPLGCSVSQRGHATIVGLASEQVFADPYRLELRPDADARLDLLATALLLHPELDVAVVGYTGTSPIPRAWQRTFATHRQQSVAMAEALVRHLESHYEIAPRRFVVAGRGAWSPVSDDAAGDDPNYRIEVMLYRTGAPPPAPSVDPQESQP